MESFKKVLLLGASGSIGSQALDIIREAKDKFKLTSFSVGNNVDAAIKILGEFRSVKHIYVISLDNALKIHKQFPRVKIYYGKGGLAKLTKTAVYDMCIDALVGFAGFIPATIALKKNKILCLANKEALVVGGPIINRLLSKGKGKLYPIDSEHVALAKCLASCEKEDVKRLIITASGGALRNVPIEKLKDVKASEALKHPTWKMGNKITIDCATMMNKGFEIIEAYYLYGYLLEKISVLMHDESLVHSAVELNDGSFIIEYGKPDMHNPIKWAMYEGQNKYSVQRIKSFSELKDCHFHDYNPERYPCTEIAKKCLLESPARLVALNGANEVLVNRYLKGEIGFLDISSGVKEIVEKTPKFKRISVNLIKKIDRKSRREARHVK